MDNNNDMMMKNSLHNLLVEFENVTDSLQDEKNYDRGLEIADKLSTILKRLSDMGYNPSGDISEVKPPSTEIPKIKKGKEESK